MNKLDVNDIMFNKNVCPFKNVGVGDTNIEERLGNLILNNKYVVRTEDNIFCLCTSIMFIFKLILVGLAHKIYVVFSIQKQLTVLY
jgi:hypothetical protein